MAPDNDIANAIGEVTDRVSADWNAAAPDLSHEYADEGVADGVDEYVDESEAYEQDPDWVDEPVWQEEQAQSQGWVDPTEAQAYVAYEQERAADVQQAQEFVQAEAGADYAVELTRTMLEQQGLREVDPEVVALQANETLAQIGQGLMADGYSSDEALQLMREHDLPRAVLQAQAEHAKVYSRYQGLEDAFLREFRNVP